MKFSIYRYNPDTDTAPHMQDYEVRLKLTDSMLLHALIRIQEMDDSLALRRSCREGICGSDAMNINGKNGLACVTPLAGLKEPVHIRPMPGMPVIRDLIVDMSQFFKQYISIKPYLVNDEPPPERERLQSPVEREKLNGLYECIGGIQTSLSDRPYCCKPTALSPIRAIAQPINDWRTSKIPTGYFAVIRS